MHLLLIAFVYMLGATMALALGASYDQQHLFFGLLVLLVVSSSVHYANEYADWETDALTQRTLFSGGSGALPSSTVPRRVALRVGWVGLAVGFMLALLGWAAGALNSTALFILAIGTFLGWMYSVLPLALVFLNLLATTWPDREADLAVGKRMLATRWSPARLRRAYWVVAALFFLMFPMLVGWSLPPRVAWSSYLVAPLVIIGGLLYTKGRSPLPSDAAMVTMAVVQFAAWFSLLPV